MTQKKEIIRQVFTFLIILSIFTTIIFIMMFRADAGHMDMSWTALMMWAPGISAMATALIFKDRINNFGWKPGKAKYLGYAYLLPLIIGLTAYGLAWILGLINFYGDEAANYKWIRMIGIETPAPVWVGIISKLVLASLMTIFFALGEEIGWSGFLTPRLLKLMSIPKASLIVGLYWSVWHYPAIIDGNVYGYGTPLWISLPAFTLVLTGLSFFRTYLVAKSKSLWTGTLLHVSHNMITMGIFFDLTLKTKTASYFVSETGIITGMVSLFAAIAFWYLKSKKFKITS